MNAATQLLSNLFYKLRFKGKPKKNIIHDFKLN